MSNPEPNGWNEKMIIAWSGQQQAAALMRDDLIAGELLPCRASVRFYL